MGIRSPIGSERVKSNDNIFNIKIFKNIISLLHFLDIICWEFKDFCMNMRIVYTEIKSSTHNKYYFLSSFHLLCFYIHMTLCIHKRNILFSYHCFFLFQSLSFKTFTFYKYILFSNFNHNFFKSYVSDNAKIRGKLIINL